MRIAIRLMAAPVILALLALLACDKTGETNQTKGSTATPDVGSAKSAEPRDPNRLWCNEHGVYEDECVICHPEIAEKNKQTAERDPNRLWCNEHGLYEDECVICHPELKGKLQAEEGQTNASGAAQTSSTLMCEEHGVAEAECGICHPELLADMPAGKGLKVRFASGASAGKAGIATTTPAAKPGAGPQEFTGQITFNRNNLAAVTPLIGGVVVEVLKDAGDTVKAGEVLAVVKSAEVATAKSQYAKALAEAKLARQTYEREKTLYERQISARRDMEEAQAAVAVSQSAVEEARQYLLSLGVTDSQAKDGADAASLLPVRSPLDGTVIERKTVQGTAVEPGDELFQVADLSVVWMQLSVPETQLAQVQTGAKLRARFDAYPGMTFEGEVQWIAPRINPDTRMLEARAVFPNSQGLLKDGLFGHASLDGPAGNLLVTVPSDAVQEVEGQPVVFRKLEDDLYETRRVELGAAEDGQVVILTGLAPGEEFVSEGSYVVKSELLKARLGAGCTDH